MPIRKEFRVSPQVAFTEEGLEEFLAHKKNLPSDYFKLTKRSIDARSSKVWVNITVDFFEENENELVPSWSKNNLKDVSGAPEFIIVGAGPAGLFAALKCLEKGLRPIVLERGKDVRSRRRDLAAINKEHVVNPESNYCFGEGGAGTYSDGKLYTRSKKRGDVQRILKILVAHGANEDILVDAHPHIGTNKLPKIIQAIRETIVEYGGEVRFDSKVTGFIIKDQSIRGVRLSDESVEGVGVLLATGHSARDIFELCVKEGVYIEAKPFALGVRVEHQQSLIDNLQYGLSSKDEYLPAASYSLVSQINEGKEQRGVFSFCMCPGGFVVPSATAQGEVVVNGMSPSKRDSVYSNSGIVVNVDLPNFKAFAKEGPLAGLRYQQTIEQMACKVAGDTQNAPAQRLVDFVNGKVSNSLNDCSYIPGLTSCNMDDVLPKDISYVLKQGFRSFGKKMKGYFSNEAQILGVESRTSSPVRIPRDRKTYEHIEIKNLYPCGEGAGYAGGIMSAAIDGEKCVEAFCFND